jgi:hypothetical protein
MDRTRKKSTRSPANKGGSTVAVDEDLGSSNSDLLDDMAHDAAGVDTKGGAPPPSDGGDDPATDGPPAKATGSGGPDKDDTSPDLDKPNATAAGDKVDQHAIAPVDEPALDVDVSVDGPTPLTVGSGPPGDTDPGPSDVPAPNLLPVPAVRTPAAPTAPVASLEGEALERFVQETGCSPAEHAAELQGQLDDATSESRTAQRGLLDARDRHLGDVASAETNATTAVDTAVTTGRGRVDGAFRRAGEQTVGAANAGIQEVETSFKAGSGQLTTTAKGRRDEVGTAMRTSGEAVTSIREKGAQEYLGLLQTGAQGLDAIATTVKADAVKAGAEQAKTFESAAKSQKGVASLHEESKAEIAKGVGTGAGNAIDMRVKVRKHNLESRAAGAAEAAVSNETAPLSEQLETTREAADLNVDAAERRAVGRLGDSRQTAVGTLESTRDAAAERADAERERAQARLDAAEKSLRDDAIAMAAELRNSIEVRAATDADTYARVTDGLADTVRGLDGVYRASDLAPTISSAVARIQESSATHLGELAKLASGGITTFETGVDDKIDGFDAAVDEQERQAETFRAEQHKVIRGAVTGFSGGISGMVLAFDQELGRAVAPVGGKAKALELGAKEAIELYKQMVTEAFAGVEGELIQLAADEIARIPEEIDKGAEAKTMSKRTSIVSSDIPALFTAMDGMGTDEDGIYKVLRKMSWGQIEGLEALWNQYKKHSLRWYFEDEMSGNDLAIAMAYLNHDRVKALKLELEDSIGFWNDDEARIEEVMRAASADEMSTLTTQHSATITKVKGNLGGADLAAFNALADTSMSREDAALKADAIRLHEAMDGMGTDEAAVKRILEGAKSPAEREKLRAFYGQYSGGQGDKMGLDDRLKYEFTGMLGKESDYHLVLELAKVERDDAAVSAAKVFSAGDGMGTDETAMFDALKSDVGKWDSEIAMLEASLASDQPRTADQQAEIEIRLSELKGKKSKHFQTLDSKIAEFTGDSKMTMEGYVKSELQEGLELKIGMDSLKKGKADPADLVVYATDGLGTDEDMLKKALQDDSGNPLSKADVEKINETLKKQGRPTLDVIAGEELSGRDLHEFNKLMLGKPETPEDLKKLVDMDYDFENSGFGRGLMVVKGALGMSTALEEMDYAKDQFDDKYGELEARGLSQTKLDEISKTDPELAQVIKELGITSQKSSEAYGKSLSATVDALITTLEIIGGIIATIATAGAASPALALLIANIAIGTAGIIVKKALLGDTYAWEEAGADFVKMASTAALGAALGKVEKIGKVADTIGKSGTDLFQSAASKTGMFFTGKAWELGPQSTAYLSTFIKAGSKKVMTGGVTDFYGGLWNDKEWDKGMEHWIGNAALGAAGNMHQNFISGGSAAMYDKWAGDRKKDAFLSRSADRGVDVAGIDPSVLTHGSLAADMLYGARDGLGKHVVGHFSKIANYSDAGKFWDNLVAGGPKAMISGALDAYGDRKALPSNVARDLANGAMSADQYKVLHGELTADEQLKIGRALPPSRMPTELASIVASDANDRLISYGPSPVDGTTQPSYDADKIMSADVVTIAQALRGGLPFDQVKDRTFSAEERLLIAQIAAGTNKLPADFLDSVTIADFRKLEAYRVVVAVEIGWDKVPDALRADAVAEIATGSLLSTQALLTRFKGQDLPVALRDAVAQSTQDMTRDELVKLGQIYGFDALSKLGPDVQAKVASAVGAQVQDSKAGKDPSLVASAIQLGQLELTDEALAKLALSPKQKLDVLTGLGQSFDLTKLPPAFRDDAMKSVLDLLPNKRIDVATKTWPLLDTNTRDAMWGQMNGTEIDRRLKFIAAVPASDVPASVVADLHTDFKHYQVMLALKGGGVDISQKEWDKLRALAGPAPAGSP